jgi:hypothetical protein
MQDEYLSAWLDRPYVDIYQWGTVHDPRTPPPPPPQPPMWGVGIGWGAGTLAGGWGGGWGQHRRRRKRPRRYGFRTMGAIFRQPRPVDWQAQLRERQRGWLI